MSRPQEVISGKSAFRQMHTPDHLQTSCDSGLLHWCGDISRGLLEVGQGALRDVCWLFVLHVDVLQHLLPMPQFCQVLLDQSVFPL